MSGGHSILAPSSSARRIQCPQSTTLEAAFPEDAESEEAREGEAAHWASSEMLAGRLIDEGQIAPNGVVLTREMADGADLYYDDVVRTLQPYGLTPQHCAVESRVAIPRVHPQSRGTPDCYVTVPGKPMKLFLWDYKFGHRYVEVFQNFQCVEYAAGIVGHVPDLDPGVEIVITIVQPRAFHREGPVRRWRTTLADLRALINIASTGAHEALGPQPRTRVGPECRDCRARHACPTLQAAGYADMDFARHETPLVMSPAAAGLELKFINRAMQRLKARASGLEEQLKAAARRGEQTPGWLLQPGESRERWKVPAAQVVAVGQALHLDLSKPVDAVTPTQARQKGMHPDIVAQFAERPPAGMVLVEDDGSAARRAFT